MNVTNGFIHVRGFDIHYTANFISGHCVPKWHGQIICPLCSLYWHSSSVDFHKIENDLIRLISPHIEFAHKI